MIVRYSDDYNLESSDQLKNLLEVTNKGFDNILKFSESRFNSIPSYPTLISLDLPTLQSLSEQLINQAKQTKREMETLSSKNKSTFNQLSSKASALKSDITRDENELNQSISTVTRCQADRTENVKSISDTIISKTRSAYQKNDVMKAIFKSFVSVLSNEELNEDLTILEKARTLKIKDKIAAYKCTITDVSILVRMNNDLTNTEKLIEERKDDKGQSELRNHYDILIRCSKNMLDEGIASAKIKEKSPAIEEKKKAYTLLDHEVLVRGNLKTFESINRQSEVDISTLTEINSLCLQVSPVEQINSTEEKKGTLSFIKPKDHLFV